MKTRLYVTMSVAVVFATTSAVAEWVGVTTGADDDADHDYLNGANWAGGEIDNVFDWVDSGGSLTLYFTDDFTATGTVVHTYSPWADTQWNGSGGNRTVTLHEGIVHQIPSIVNWQSSFNIGATEAGRGLTLRLPDTGTPHAIWTGSDVAGDYNWPSIRLINGLTGDGDMDKQGRSRLEIHGNANAYAGVITIYGGTVRLLDDSTLLGVPVLRIREPKAGEQYVSELIVTRGQQGRLQIFSDDTPVIFDTRNGTWGSATLRIFADAISYNGMATTNGIGRLVLQSGLSTIRHGFQSPRDATFFMRTEAKALERPNRAVGQLLPANDSAEVNIVYGPGWSFEGFSTNCNPAVGVWREAGDYAGGNVLVVAEPLTLQGSLVPFLLGQDNHTNEILTTFVTYDPETGFRALRQQENALTGEPAEFVEGIASAGEDDNVYGAVSETLVGSKTVNSLYYPNTQLFIYAPDVLTIKGGVIYTHSMNGNGTFDFGDAEGILYKTGSWGFTPVITGNNGFTLVALNGSIQPMESVGRYSGQTTIARGAFAFYACDGQPWYPMPEAANKSLPDDTFVLVHPGTAMQIGWHGNPYGIREIIGGVGGCGTVRLGYTSYPASDESEWRNDALIIGTPPCAYDDPGYDGDYWVTWTNTYGRVLVNGGTVQPGMAGQRGTLSFTVGEQNQQPFPVELKNGTLAVTIGKDLECDAIAVTGDLIIGGGTNLVLDVTVEEGAVITEEMAWTIATAGTLDVQGAKLFTQVESNHPKWTFAASAEGDRIVIAPVRRTAGTTLIVR